MSCAASGWWLISPAAYQKWMGAGSTGYFNRRGETFLIHVTRKVAQTDRIRCGARINDRIGFGIINSGKDGSVAVQSAASATCKFKADKDIVVILDYRTFRQGFGSN